MKLAALLVLALAVPACSAQSERAAFQGYVEGEFVEVAPEIGGRIADLAVRRGDAVEAGAPLFRLEAAEAEASVAQARAELARAAAQLANLRQGQRPAEIAVIEAQIAEAEAELDAAREQYERQLVLFERRVVAEARLDEAREAVRVAEARVAAVRRQKEVATLPARSPQIEAGERAVEAAQAALVMVEARLAEHAVIAPAAGRIEDVYYEIGEVVREGGAVLSLLPEGRRKLVFFVPEPARPALQVGEGVTVACDGCPPHLTARVSFMAIEAEFTPPVIFSRDTRAKLVFRAEAVLAGDAARLPLGQPVEVALAERVAP